MSLTVPTVRLLVVEDDPFYSELVRVAAAGCDRFREVETVGGGPEALDRLFALAQAHGALPDLILSDLKMPEIDGLELIGALREHAELRRIPVAIMTSSELESDRDAALRAGCRHFFAKPPTVRALVEELKRLPEHCLEPAKSH